MPIIIEFLGILAILVLIGWFFFFLLVTTKKRLEKKAASEAENRDSVSESSETSNPKESSK